MRTRLLLIAIAALLVAAAPPASAAGGACSQATALRVAKQLHWGDPTLGANRVGQVLCGAFLGRGSRAMVASASLPSCGGSYEWAVFRLRAGTWRRVLRVRHGAGLSAQGSDIVETRGVLLPGDAHCFPSGSKSRVWHWNGTRLAPGRWAAKPAGGGFLSPDRQVWCSMSAARAWCATRDTHHRATLTPDGRLAVCDEPSPGGCLQNWDDGLPVLPPGQAVDFGGFHCAADARGISCTVAASGVGFSITAAGVTPLAGG